MFTASLSQMTTTTTQPPIQIITFQMTCYGPIILLIIGIISCLGNFITFTSPQLRHNSCAFYFLMSTVFELLSITYGLISRFAADHLGSTLIDTNRVYCKLRAYLVSALPLVATYLVLLSSIDRFMSSSVHVRFRSFSQIKVAYRATLIAIVIGFSSCSHILVLYDLRPRCSTMPGAYAMFDSMFVVFWLGIIPHALMLVFAFLTYMNVKQSKRHLKSYANRNTVFSCQKLAREQKKERQLIMMMLAQVGLSSLLVLTRMIYYAYYILAPPLTGYNKLIGSFLMSFTTLVYYANYTKSFYIYTLTSPFFRTVFIQRVTFFMERMFCRHKPTIFSDSGMKFI